MRWIDCIIPLRPKGGLGFEDFDAMEDSFFIQVKDELFGDDWLHCYVTQILNAKYEYIDIRDVFDELMHLNAKQKADLLHILIENKSMFDGTLGVYHHSKIHIDVDQDAIPKHSRPYPVPRIHLNTF
jgi:hypothetical protein